MIITFQEKTLLPGVREALLAFFSPLIPTDLHVTLQGDKKGYKLEISGDQLALPTSLSDIQTWCKKHTEVPRLAYAGYILDQVQRQLLTPSGKEIALTEKETALLDLFFRHVGETFSKKDLLTTLWGWSEDAQTHTVESHIYALRQKCPSLPITVGPDGYQLLPT